MSRDTNKLLKITCNYEKIGLTSLIIEAKKKEKKKLDPKAKIRNRGTVCVPAESAKDKKDHFPINDEGQARSALSRVEGLTSAPWYSGSLEGLRALVKRKVHAKYPSIGKSEKKSSIEISEELLNKYAQFRGNPDYDEKGNFIGAPAKPTTPSAAISIPTTIVGDPGSSKPQVDPKVRQLQSILRFTYALTGKDGKPLAVDGVMGPNTQFALQSYKTEYNMPQATDAIAMNHVLNTVSEGKTPGGYAGNVSTTTGSQSPEMNTASDVISKATAFLQGLPAQFQMGRPKNLNNIYLQLQQMGGQLTTALPSLQANPQLLGQAQQVSQQIGQWLTQIAGQAHPAVQRNRRQQKKPTTPATASISDKLIEKYGKV